MDQKKKAKVETKAKVEVKTINLREKLVLIQNKIVAPKSKYNKFGDFYYRSLEDILQALKPLLQEFNVSFVLNDDLILIGDRYYIRAIAQLTDVKSGEMISTTALARETFEKTKMDDAQITGGASSYARKYAISGLLLLDDNKDPDGLDNDKSKKPVTPAQVKGKYTPQTESGKPVSLGKTEYLEKVVLADEEYEHRKGISKSGKPFDGFFPTTKGSQAKLYYSVASFQADLAKYKKQENQDQGENINPDDIPL